MSKLRKSGTNLETLMKAALISALAVLLALIVNLIRPGRLPLLTLPESPAGNVRIITLEELIPQQPGASLILDARSAEKYRQGHLAGALNVPALEVDRHLKTIRRHPLAGLQIVIYCENESCGESQWLANRLTAHGWAADKIRIFAPGWETLEQHSEIRKSIGNEP